MPTRVCVCVTYVMSTCFHCFGSMSPYKHYALFYVFMCVCMCASVRVCVRVCVCV